MSVYRSKEDPYHVSPPCSIPLSSETILQLVMYLIEVQPVFRHKYVFLWDRHKGISCTTFSTAKKVRILVNITALALGYRSTEVVTLHCSYTISKSFML